MKILDCRLSVFALVLLLALSAPSLAQDCGDGADGMGSSIPGNSTAPSGAALSVNCPGAVSVPGNQIAQGAPGVGPMEVCTPSYYLLRVTSIAATPGGCGGTPTGSEWYDWGGWEEQWQFVLLGEQYAYIGDCALFGSYGSLHTYCLQPTAGYEQYVEAGSTTVNCTASGGFPPYHFASQGQGVTVNASTGAVTVMRDAGSSFSVSLEDEATQERTAAVSVTLQ